MKLEDQTTLAFLLSAASQELFPGRILFIEHSLSDGYYCHFGKEDIVKKEEIKVISEKMGQYLLNKTEIKFEETPREKLLHRFSSQNRMDKVALLEKWEVDPVPCVRFGEFLDYRFGPMNTDKNVLQLCKLRPYDVGFLLRFFQPGQKEELDSFVDAPKLYQVIKEHETWGNILGISNIGELNKLIMTGNIDEMIRVAEGLHEKKISRIADSLCEDFLYKRIVFIAGPSASGKTTFSKRLGIQLKVNGFSNQPISMDNYYLNREEMPDDIESISSLNMNLLCDHLSSLERGEVIPERKFDFARGVGYETGKEIKIPQDTFIVVEGIHGLNPLFSEQVGIDRIQRIYVSALTQLNVDNEHRVSTSDNRLFRRIVRDVLTRGYSSDNVLTQWPRVRYGEENNIFPYQEEADFMFNSSLVYEIPVLANQAIPLLKKIKRSSQNFQTAERLLTFLSLFIPISPDSIPEISILREFIGGKG